MWSLRIRYGYPRYLTKAARYFGSKALLSQEEYTETPQYPPILELSYEKVKEREKRAEHDEVQRVKTVEEKQIKLNMPRYYGFKCYILQEDKVPYDNLHFTQYVTRTHLIQQDILPEYYRKIEVKDELVASLRKDIEEGLLLEFGGYRKTPDSKEETDAEKENRITSAVTRHINRALINNLARSNPHLTDVQVDIDPRHEASWFIGGLAPPERVRNWRRKKDWSKHLENEPVDRAMHYSGMPTVSLRSALPLPAVIPYTECENPGLDVPYYEWTPECAEIFPNHLHLTNTPGFWPGDAHQFGLLSYHKRGYMLDRKCDDSQDALHRQGIVSAFGWLASQANFLGFTTVNDVTYPLTTQCIITNGKLWSFYVYQLNTMLLHSEHATKNPKRNVCWATKEFQLFEDVQDGKVIGFNEDILKTLVKFYANAPGERSVELRPYLDKNTQLVAHYEDDDKRAWLEREYKFLTANKPRHYLQYEIYDWEWIYKIRHQKMPMAARRRPFELSVNPWKRRLEDRHPKYIPRKLRPDLPRHKGRFCKEYWP